MAAKATAVPQLMDTVSDTLESAGQTAGQILTNLPIWLSKLILAALVVLVGVMVIRLGRGLIHRMVQGRKGAGARTPGQRETLHSLVISVFNYTMLFSFATPSKPMPPMGETVSGKYASINSALRPTASKICAPR